MTQFCVLGPLQVRDEAVVKPVRRGLPRSLLIYLLLHGGEPVAVPQLADQVWEGAPPSDPANAVHRVVAYLRRSLGQALPLHTTTAGYALDVNPDHVDAMRFTRLVAASARQDTSAAKLVPTAASTVLGAVDEALALWRGEPLVDVASHLWAAPEIGRLTEAHLQAQELRLTALLALGRHREVVPEARAAVAAHPLRESLYGPLVVALYRGNRQSEALAVMSDLRRTLREELGVDPGAASVDLEQRILRHDPALRAVHAVEHSAQPDPAPQVVDRPAQQAPRPVTSLVGRAADVSAVAGLLDEHRLVTLTGPGGVGKTRVALAAVEGLPGNVWFVDLRDVAENLVPHVIAAAVQAPTKPGRDIIDAVVARLAEVAGLLLLDSCERAIDAVARVADSIHQMCPRVRQLVTTRRLLGVAGEVVHPIAPLPLATAGADTGLAAVSPAVQLFVERAVDLQPDFVVDESTIGDVAAICRTLDGLPLAIELAAAQMDVLNPVAIRRRLSDRFALLVADSRGTGNPGHQTLQATIGSSVDLLTIQDRNAFARLGVFAGSFGLDAAIAVIADPDADPDAAFRALVSLVRQSLVMRAGADSYRLLDSVRLFAADLLVRSPDAADVRARHAEHFAALAEDADLQLRTPSQDPWLQLLRASRADLRAALSWSLDGGAVDVGARLAGALAWFWMLEGSLAEGLGWLERAHRLPLADPQVRAQVLLGIGQLSAPLGELRRARDACEAAAALCSEAGNNRGAGDALITLGVAQWGLGNLEAAAAAHDEAIVRLTAAGDLWRRGVATVLRARTAVDSAEPDADERITAAMTLARRVGDAHLIGLALIQQTRQALRRDDPEEAETAARQALALSRRISYREGEAAALTLQARAVLAGSGDPETAEYAAAEAARIASTIGHSGAVCHALEVIAEARSAAGRWEDAFVLLEVADAERAAQGIPAPALESVGASQVRERTEAALGPNTAHLRGTASALTVSDLIATLDGPGDRQFID